MSYIPAPTNHGDLAAVQAAGLPTTFAQRRAARDITRIRIRGAVVTAREITKVDAIGDVAESALLTSSQVSRLRGALSQGDPHGEADALLITRSTSVALADVVLRTGRSL
ncbi:MAG TPA: hypothetical protein VFY36_03640 [Solirubrobacteraceae bacterium]|nr:hypothetical protein [Solirubrobacteraceae bacterium]